MDVDYVGTFLNGLVRATGARVPTVLVLNLEGRFPSASVIYDLVVRLGRSVASGHYGQLALVLATPDPALGNVIRALAEANSVSLFLAPSVEAVEAAEPVGRLTPTDLETLALLSQVGGRASVSSLAKAASIDHTAAGNRISALDRRQLVLRVDRPRRQGNVYLDPRVATPPEEAIDPRSPESGASPEILADVRALADIQGTEAPSAVAEAWREFLQKHASELAVQHEKVSTMMQTGDRKAVESYAARHAKTRARSRSRRPPTR